MLATGTVALPNLHRTSRDGDTWANPAPRMRICDDPSIGVPAGVVTLIDGLRYTLKPVGMLTKSANGGVYVCVCMCVCMCVGFIGLRYTLRPVGMLTKSANVFVCVYM
jgi:hypothetical protein